MRVRAKGLISKLRTLSMHHFVQYTVHALPCQYIWARGGGESQYERVEVFRVVEFHVE